MALIGTAALDVEQFFADHSDRQPRRSATLTGQLPREPRKGAMKTPTTLIILDGFALGRTFPATPSRPPPPQLDYLFSQYPFCQLEASGLDVGLPEGQMGNSEVGHTNIGAGRVVFQDLPADQPGH